VHVAALRDYDRPVPWFVLTTAISCAAFLALAVLAGIGAAELIELILALCLALAGTVLPLLVLIVLAEAAAL